MKSHFSGNLITFEVEQASLRNTERALGRFRDQAPRVLKNAVNKTARQAKTDLATEAQKTYVVKKTRFAKAMKQKNATQAVPVAVIHITGEQLELKDFKVSPASYRPNNRPKVLKAKGLVSSSLKPLETSAGKAFTMKFSNGHVSVVQRRTGNRLPVKKLMSSSIPVMTGNEKRVYGIVKPNIEKNLLDNLHAEIEKVKQSG